jgi:hypothetical protein
MLERIKEEFPLVLFVWLDSVKATEIYEGLYPVKLNLCGMHPVALPMIRYRHIIYTMYIYTYNPQSQQTILTLFLLILSPHVSVLTDHLQVTIPTSYVFV